MTAAEQYREDYYRAFHRTIELELKSVHIELHQIWDAKFLKYVKQKYGLPTLATKKKKQQPN